MTARKPKYMRYSIKKDVTPREFLELVKSKPEAIKASKIVLPKLGSDNLGRIVVELKY